jgi:hypothetical protein
MKQAAPAARLLRWYPASWRVRYGEEFSALIEDSYGNGAIPFADQLATVKAGLTERLRATGLSGDGESPVERTRSGALLVVCAWSAFTVADVIFAKFAEHWDASTPSAFRSLPGIAFNAVQWAALAGAAIVLIAAVAASPSALRFVRREGWSAIHRPLLWTAGFGVLTALVGTGVVFWAHQLTTHERNGGLWGYGAAFVLLAVLVTATLAAGTASTVAVTNRIDLSAEVLRALGILAVALTTAMAVIAGGTVTWWASLALHAPRALGGGVTASGHVVPPALVVAGLLMVVGLAAAGAGARRVLRALPFLGPSD